MDELLYQFAPAAIMTKNLELLFMNRFQCRIPIPLEVDPESVESSVTPDGMLIITAQRMPKHREVIVPVIQMNHEPHRTEHPHLTPGCP